MPNNTQDAIDWALQQTVINDLGDELSVTSDNSMLLVSKVREYFNANNVAYQTFGYDDLIQYL